MTLTPFEIGSPVLDSRTRPPPTGSPDRPTGGISIIRKSLPLGPYPGGGGFLMREVSLYYRDRVLIRGSSAGPS